MKKWYLVLLALLFAGTISAEDNDGFRTFTDTEGRTIQARILDYDAVKGRIQIVREDGKKAWVSPNVFSDTDQAYIGEWVAADCVLAEKNLRVSVKECRRERFGDGNDTERGEVLYYEVKLENRSGQDIQNLEIEYRVFIKVSGTGDSEDLEKQDGELIHTGPVENGKTKTICTKDIRVTERYKSQTEASYDLTGYSLPNVSLVKVSEEEVIGIGVRIYGSKVGGVPSIREFYYPEQIQGETLQWLADDELYLSTIIQGKASDKDELKKWIIDAAALIRAETDAEALKRIDKAVESFYVENLDSNGVYAMLIALLYRDKNMYERALAWLVRAERKDDKKGLFYQLLLISEIYSSAPDSEVRDGKKAVEYAKNAEELGEGLTERIIAKSQLAAAYAQNGEFDLAVAKQEQAIAELPSVHGWASLVYNERLEVYRSKKALILEIESPREWFYSPKVGNRVQVTEPEWSVENTLLASVMFSIKSSGTSIPSLSYTTR